MQKENIIKNKSHSVLDTESLLVSNNEILNQVQDDLIIKQKGFTLIELLVVVLIIGILAAVALPQYQRAVDKTKITNLVALSESIKKAQDVYYLDNGSYAEDNLSVLDISFKFPGVYLDPQYKDRIYIFGNTYMPGILLIVPYTHSTSGSKRSCHASSSNERAMAACKYACQTNNLYTDGAWKACIF